MPLTKKEIEKINSHHKKVMREQKRYYQALKKQEAYNKKLHRKLMKEAKKRK